MVRATIVILVLTAMAISWIYVADGNLPVQAEKDFCNTYITLGGCNGF